MKRLAQFVTRHRWWVVGGWIVAIVAIQALASAAGGANYKDDFKLPHTESQTVADLLQKAGLGQQNNATGTLVLHARSGALTTEPSSLAPALLRLCANRAAHIAEATTPWNSLTCAGHKDVPAPRPDLLSPNQRTAIVSLTFDIPNPDQSVPPAVYTEVKPLRSAALQVELTGSTLTGADASSGGLSPQVIGFIAAFIILILVFRTVSATVLPLLSAAAALGSGLGLLALLTHVMSVASFAPQLADLMVIGVGIDYALFIVTRHRRNLRLGMPVNDSIANAVNTSGRAVLLAGLTVCVALLGLCALGVSFLYGVAVGTSLGVALTMMASLTLLPALLSLFGFMVLPRRQRRALKAGERLDPDSHTGFWTGWANLVRRRSILFALASAALVVALSIPFFGLRLGHADQSNDPAGSTTRRGYDLIQRDFGKGYNSTLQLVVAGPQATDKAYLTKISTAVAGVPDVNRPSVHVLPVDRNIAFVIFKSVSGPQDVATNTLVRTLRSTTLPPLSQGTANHIYVYGETAVFLDFAKVLSSKLVLFILAVVGLSFLLLVVAFRSIVIPLTAAAMNLLAAAASFGVIVAIFQWGWLGDALGVGSGGPIEAFVPVIFFAILFGLSMDYQVFLVSRMHEEWTHTGDNSRAVTIGQGETGGIITAAGLIMISVFGGFILGDARVIKLLGIGLASAIFIDAFIVRTLLVPSLMHRIGRANWWYPAALDRITPRISLEAEDEPEIQATTDPDEHPELVPA